MNSEDSNMAASAICHAADMIKIAWQEAGWEYQRPCVVFKPTLSKDGNMWCALFGDNLQEGVAGFGETPQAAMWAFDQAWANKDGSHTIPAKDAAPDVNPIIAPAPTSTAGGSNIGKVR